MGADAAKITALSNQILQLAHDDILMHLRFFDMALANMKWQERPQTGCVATNGSVCYYDPVYILKEYQNEPKSIPRLYLHVLLHCIFSHGYHADKLDRELWNLATDIAVENVIAQMQLAGVTLPQDEEQARKLMVLQEDAGGLTAERLYRYFRNQPPTPGQREELTALFARDSHELWDREGQTSTEELSISEEQWKKISERIKADLKSFTKLKNGAETLEENLERATRDRYDYSEILKHFTERGEDITINDEEFDYIYYTYGLEHYGNMPLIEPLEYKEIHKVREFCIAIDTSASCRGPIVQAFLRKTYSLLKGSENFFHKVNVHIIQCDNEVQSDTKVTNDEEFEHFMKYGKLNGFGATDFRPVFTYVDELKARGEFEDLKGLIYFTDGYGIYPERMPDYDVIFAFLDEDEHRAPVPPWSMKVILESEDLEET